MRHLRSQLVVLVAPVLALLTAACGQAGDGPAEADASPETTISESVGTIGLEVAEIAAGEDPDVVVATLTDVPQGEGTCAVPITPMLEEEAERVHVWFFYESPQVHVYEVRDGGFTMLDGWSDADGCERGPQAVEVALGEPLAGRAVITQSPTARWQAGPDGRYVRCELPACDPSTGQPPAPAGCGDSTLPEAVRRGDVPRRSGITVQACELPWAVVDIDVGASACPATGDGPSPCAGTNIDRTYWEAVDGRWDMVAASSGPGCGKVHEHLPDLPVHLCAALPPVP